MADEKDVELQRLRRRVKELETAIKTCNDCKYLKPCIGAEPDGKWEACEQFEEKEMNNFKVLGMHSYKEYQKRKREVE